MNAANPEVERQLRLIENLDLEPIAFKLVRPDPGETGMTDDQAYSLVAKYRRFLMLHVMHPEKSIVPSKEIDQVWHAHILDTAKYYEDCMAVFGFVLHHFPYLGLRGPEDETLLNQMFAVTKLLYQEAFGEDMCAGLHADSMNAACSTDCMGGGLPEVRPRLQRA